MNFIYVLTLNVYGGDGQDDPASDSDDYSEESDAEVN